MLVAQEKPFELFKSVLIHVAAEKSSSRERSESVGRGQNQNELDARAFVVMDLLLLALKFPCAAAQHSTQTDT